MKKLTLIFATVIAVALLMTGCFGTTEPAPTATATLMPTATATVMPTESALPTATDLPAGTDLPAVTDLPEASDGLNVAPSPSASTAP